ncbi:MAG: HAD family phosphatase [Streptomycetaceae bacterium]|nr:HAD family phosphatase [Streptomycetaceae bacterium]
MTPTSTPALPSSAALPSKSPRGAERWLLMDYNGVIGRQPTAAHWSQLRDSVGWAHGAEDFESTFWAERLAYDAGQITDGQFWQRVLGRSLPSGDLLHTVAVDAAMWLHTDERVLDLLRTVAARGIGVAMLSNAPVPVAEAIAAAPWSTVFGGHLAFSAHLGVNKPDPEAYTGALRLMGDPDPGTVLFVDDRADNVAAARALGIHAVHYTGGGDLHAAVSAHLSPAQGAMSM